jgi:hypothetical protein
MTWSDSSVIISHPFGQSLALVGGVGASHWAAMAHRLNEARQAEARLKEKRAAREAEKVCTSEARTHTHTLVHVTEILVLLAQVF